jgi:hypothetical protein
MELHFDLGVVYQVAESRTKVNTKRGSRDLQVMDGIRSKPDYIGVAVEIVGPDWLPKAKWTPNVLDKPDKGYDAVLPDGRWLDVKGTTHKKGHLLVPTHQFPPVADLLALGVVDEENQTVDMVGYITKEGFVERASHYCKVCRMAPRDGVWVHQTDLAPIKKLQNVL